MKTEATVLQKNGVAVNGRKSPAKANVELAPQREQTPSDLLHMAVQNNFDLDRLQRIIDIHDAWEKKMAKKDFLAALSKFQTLVPVLRKMKTAKVPTKTGGSFTYKYADLGSIAQAIKRPLEACGLAYRWEFSERDGRMKVTCIVSHISGHTETATMEGAPDSSGAKNDIQQKGSTHTYLQRYTLIGALGLATADEDSDAQEKKPTKETPERAQEERGDEAEAEVMGQWRQVLADCKTRVQLTSIFLKNQKAVEGSEKLKALFKEREQELKELETPKTALP